MKKLFALLLTLLLLASIPSVALATGEIYTEGTLYYVVGDDTITIVGCFGKNETITVPSSIGGIPVNTIASGAFTGNKYLKTVLLPDTITTVEGGAFGGGVSVVYNYNVPAPTPTPEQPAQPSEPASEPTQPDTTQPSGGASSGGSGSDMAEGSGTVDLGDTAPSSSSGGSGNITVDGVTIGGSSPVGDIVYEDDVDLDEIENEPAQPDAQTAAPENSPAQAEQTEQPAPAAPAEQPAQADKSGAEPAEKDNSQLLIIIASVALLLVVVVVGLISETKKRRKAKSKKKS